MKGHSKSLRVIIGRSMAGTLRQGDSGELTFEYESRYSGPPSARPLQD